VSHSWHNRRVCSPPTLAWKAAAARLPSYQPLLNSAARVRPRASDARRGLLNTSSLRPSPLPPSPPRPQTAVPLHPFLCANATRACGVPSRAHRCSSAASPAPSSALPYPQSFSCSQVQRHLPPAPVHSLQPLPRSRLRCGLTPAPNQPPVLRAPAAPGSPCSATMIHPLLHREYNTSLPPHQHSFSPPRPLHRHGASRPTGASSPGRLLLPHVHTQPARRHPPRHPPRRARPAHAAAAARRRWAPHQRGRHTHAIRARPPRSGAPARQARARGG
jgi:hypothetical protein